MRGGAGGAARAPPPPAAVPPPPPAAAATAAAAALRRRLLAHALLALSLALTGVIGSFYSPVWPVLMAVTLGASCAVQLARLAADACAELPGAPAWLFQGQGRYHAVRPEQQDGAAWEDGGEEAFELQQQVLAVGSLTAASPGRASALARILQAVHHGRDFSPEDFQSLQELDTFWGAGSGSGSGGAAALTPPQIQALPSWRFSPSPSAAKGAAAAAAAAGSGGSADAGVARALDLAAAAQLQGPGCSICLEAVAAGELLRTLPCAHNYHAACVDQWLAQSGVCPECRCPCAEEEAGGGGGAARPLGAARQR